MNARLVQIGNSRGVRLPRAAIEQAGLEDEVELVVRAGSITIRPVRKTRAGWADAAKQCQARGDDGLLLGPVSNDFDAEW